MMRGYVITIIAFFILIGFISYVDEKKQVNSVRCVEAGGYFKYNICNNYESIKDK